jgi:hypothetical protein
VDMMPFESLVLPSPRSGAVDWPFVTP